MYGNSLPHACRHRAEIFEQSFASVDVCARCDEGLELDVDFPNPQSASFVSADMRRHVCGHALYVDPCTTQAECQARGETIANSGTQHLRRIRCAVFARDRQAMLRTGNCNAVLRLRWLLMFCKLAG